MYDVIIVGSGPTGSTAAKILAERGKKILVVEKQKLPRYKSCSGMLIQKTLDLVKEYFGASVPMEVTCDPYENYGMIFTDDTGREYVFRQNGLNVWRSSFDYWLLELAKKAGANVIDNFSVIDCEQNDRSVTVTFKGNKVYKEQAQFVIDCSGVVGINKQSSASSISLPNGIKRLGGQNGVCQQAHKNVITFQTYNKGVINLDPHYFYAYLQPELSGYDAWFNVKDDMIVLGVASTDSIDITKYYNNFITYMKEKHGLSISKEMRTDKWLIRNIVPPFDIDYGVGGILKAGENAGFLNPMGEGISCGMESGYYAALAIISNFNNRQSVLDNYKDTVSDVKSYMQRQWQLVGRMSKKFSFMNQ